MTEKGFIESENMIKDASGLFKFGNGSPSKLDALPTSLAKATLKANILNREIADSVCRQKSILASQYFSGVARH